MDTLTLPDDATAVSTPEAASNRQSRRLLAAATPCSASPKRSKIPVRKEFTLSFGNDVQVPYVYSVVHRVDRVLSLFPKSSEVELPHPLTCRRVCPSPLVRGGGGNTCLCYTGGGENPNSDEGTYQHCGTLFLYM